MRPIFAMLATSLAFATPALAMEKNAPSSALQTAASKLGAVTFTANDGSNGIDGSQMKAVLTIGGEPVRQKLLVNRPNKEATSDYDVTGYAMRFHILGELNRTVALQVFAQVCEKKRVADQQIQKMEIFSRDDTFTPNVINAAPQCIVVEQTVSIPDGETVPLIVNATGKRLGTLTWNTIPSALTTPASN